MQPPITGHVVLGWDPAFRTGCKLAVVDPHRKGDRNYRNLSHGSDDASEDQGQQGPAEKNHTEVQYHP